MSNEAPLITALRSCGSGRGTAAIGGPNGPQEGDEGGNGVRADGSSPAIVDSGGGLRSVRKVCRSVRTKERRLLRMALQVAVPPPLKCPPPLEVPSPCCAIAGCFPF